MGTVSLSACGRRCRTVSDSTEARPWEGIAVLGPTRGAVVQPKEIDRPTHECAEEEIP